MIPPIELGLMRFQSRLQVKRIDGKRCLYDEVRKKWLVLQPEEMVRQLIVYYLLEEKGYNRNRISMEKGLKVNTLHRRFDLLVYDMNMQPFLLIECKAPQVAVSQEVFHQVAAYNSSLKVPYVMVSNGMTTYCCAINHEKEEFRFLEEVPDFE